VIKIAQFFYLNEFVECAK